jgi:hypothetical protein
MRQRYNNDGKQNYFGVLDDREPLVILSNIFSRKSSNESDRSAISQSRSNAELSGLEEVNIWHNHYKETIMSRSNGANSNCSVKVEVSEIYDIDPRSNFAVLRHKSLQNTEQCINLAV